MWKSVWSRSLTASDARLIISDMAHFLSEVRQSMISCRRFQATPQDFLQALHTNQLSLRALIPHLAPPVSPQLSQFRLDTRPTDETEFQEYQSISTLLAGPDTDTTKSFIPKHFPTLPDKHTYQATPEYAVREWDPRKIRECATEQGRLGEEALRKLVTAGTSHALDTKSEKRRVPSLREKREQMWKATMSSVAQYGQGGVDQAMDIDQEKPNEGHGESQKLPVVYFSSTVNSEKRFWRNPPSRRKG